MFGSSIINGVILATYDQFKEIALRKGFEDSSRTHLACAFAASVAGALAGNPIDVVKVRTVTRLKTDQEQGSNKPRQSSLGLIRDIQREEGPRAFYKGIDALSLRLGIFHCIMFVVLEQIKVAMHSKDDS